MIRLYHLHCLLPLLALLCASCDLYSEDSTGKDGPQVIWTYSLGAARDLTADYIGDNIIICSSSGSLDWVDVRSGSAVHSVSDPQMRNNGLMWFASPDGQVFYMLRNGFSYGSTNSPAEKLSCRNSQGELEWEIRMPAGDSLVSTAIAADRIFIILSDGSVMAVSRQGEMLWYRQLNAARLTGFAAYVSEQLVFLDRDGYLTVADLDGNLIWQPEEKMGFFSETLELPGGMLALYDYPIALRYFDNTGQLLWREEFPEYAPGRSNLEGASNINQYSVDRMIDGLPERGCVVSHPDGRLSALDAEGRLLWKSVLTTGNAQLICSDAEGNVFASEFPVAGVQYGMPGFNGFFSAYDSRGRLVWRTEQLGYMSSAPSVDDIGRVYVETSTDLFCLDPFIGESD